jgi:hypothetical protein
VYAIVPSKNRTDQVPYRTDFPPVQRRSGAIPYLQISAVLYDVSIPFCVDHSDRIEARARSVFGSDNWIQNCECICLWEEDSFALQNRLTFFSWSMSL